MSEISFGSRKSPDMAKKTRRARMRAERIEFRRKAVAERQAYCDSLSPQQRVESLDRKLGIGVGAMKERARLRAEIEAKVAKQIASDPQITALTAALTESITAIVKDVAAVAEQTAKAELKKAKKSKSNKGRSKRA